MRRRLLSLSFTAFLPVALLAQTASGPAFDVASIKPNRTNQGIPLVVFQPGGRMIAANVVVQQVILVAYGLEDVQLVNAPDWAATERYAIEARTNDAIPSDMIRMMLRTMLRTMLAERFGFTAHMERRDLPMFALTMVRSDQRLGPGLRASGPECAPIRPPEGVPMPPPPPTAPGRQRRRADSYHSPARRAASAAMWLDAGPRLVVRPQHHDAGAHETVDC
jgi:uncharacterized protein (TIGR03435 family)